MKKAKKIVTMFLASALLVTTSIAGTVAYLTAKTGKVENTFTVGNVSFDADAALDEAKVDEYGVAVESAERVKANEYKLIPGHKYVKDPTVHIADNSEDAYLFVKVDNGIEAIEEAGETKIAEQMKAKGWKKLDGVENVYYLEEAVKAGKDYVVFDNFTVASNADVSGYANATIKIEAYAIQADTFANAPEAWAAAPLNEWNPIV